MSLTRLSVRNPHVVAALILLVVAVGVIGYSRTPVDLFPDTAPPQVVIITIQPGASADDVRDRITEVIEKEVSTLDGLVTIRSTSRDQVSSVVVELSYARDIGQALLDVQNAIARIRSDLPQNALEPRIFRMSEATSRPLLTLALSPKKDSTKSLETIRLLAENQIKDEILRLEGIADVDVFGGHQPEVRVRLDRDALAANHISIEQVIGVLSKQNVSAPAGTVYVGSSEYLVRTAGELLDLEAIRRLPIRRAGKGLLRLSDVATVELSERDPRSVYHGNGRRAVAMGLMRPEGGATVAAIERVKELLPKLRAEYPDIRFDITQDQEPLIDLNLAGMRMSILQAIVLTVLVIFFFLADMRAALVAGVSIPLAFLFTLGILWLTPYTLNMVTLTGLIVAIGMVVDSSVVALENIYRHHEEEGESDGNGDGDGDGNGNEDGEGDGQGGGKSEPHGEQTAKQAAARRAERAAEKGTREIALAITAGMLTTVAVLIPIMFIGGYPQRTIGTLSFTIAVTLVASLVVALTVVPLLASRLLAKGRRKRNVLERAAAHVDRGVEQLKRLYLYILRKALRWRAVTLVIAAAFLVASVRIVMPLIGGELMPPMDTGIVVVSFTAPATDSPERVEELLSRVEDEIYEQEGVEMVSSVVGSEPGALSFGAGGATAQSATITIHLVDRTEREETIWEIQDKWRRRLREIPGVQTLQISEFGATPMATTKAPVDIVISGPDPRVLSELADEVMGRLEGMPGLVDVRRSWYFDEKEHDVIVDPSLARVYGTSPQQISSELNAMVAGAPATTMRLERFLDIPIRVEYRRADIDRAEALGRAYVSSDFGLVPLRALARVETRRARPFVTRENLRDTIDITGVNRIYTIAQVSRMVQKRISGVKTPRGYDIRMAGTSEDMADTQRRLMRSLLIGVVLLYLLLLAMFRSYGDPLTIMSAIPLAIAGALWGLLLFDKPMSMPGNMGMIFLAGTIINNSVLLLDFILSARKQGLEKEEAILQSVSLRIRPILMTTFSTVVGLSPLVFETAVGLERMSPLAIVASTGLVVGTFLTMVVVPVFYSAIESLAAAVSRAFGWVLGK
jgi:multidrug efflux pump subunit AcrB